MNDYKERKYLSSIEVAKYLGITVQTLHGLVKQKKIKGIIATSGQKRFKLQDLQNYKKLKKRVPKKDTKILYIIKPTGEFAIFLSREIS